MKNILIFVINLLWGFIQSFIGFAVFLFMLRKPHYWYKGSIITIKEGNWGGISLGAFVFIDKNIPKDRAAASDFVNHERGHSIQSIALGPLYLFIIGLPSLIWAGCFENWRRKHKKDYYWFYTERWADKWGRSG